MSLCNHTRACHQGNKAVTEKKDIRHAYLLVDCQIEGHISIQNSSNVGYVEARSSNKHEHRCPPEHVVYLDWKQYTIPATFQAFIQRFDTCLPLGSGAYMLE